MGYFEQIDEKHEVYITKEYGFTTDTLILADFAKPTKRDTCADFGTGCGMIAFLWKTRINPKAIYGIDIQKAAIDQAEITKKHNEFDDIHFVCADIRDIRTAFSHQQFDLIACNPPYKADGHGLKSPVQSRAIAWNEKSLTMAELAVAAAFSLKHGGKLCLCQRTERLPEVFITLSQNGLEPKRLRLVQQNHNSAATLFLLEARRGGKPGLITEPTLFIEENGDYTAEMKKVYGNYYSRSNTNGN